MGQPRFVSFSKQRSGAAQPAEAQLFHGCLSFGPKVTALLPAGCSPRTVGEVGPSSPHIPSLHKSSVAQFVTRPHFHNTVATPSPKAAAAYARRPVRRIAPIFQGPVFAYKESRGTLILPFEPTRFPLVLFTVAELSVCALRVV